MELVKCGMQSSRSGAAMLAVRGRAPNSVEMATSIVRNVISSKGVSGLYTGLTLTCLRCSIGNAAFFGVHESCWRIDRRVDPCGSSSAWKCMFYGAIAGSAYWLVSVSILRIFFLTCTAFHAYFSRLRRPLASRIEFSLLYSAHRTSRST